MGKIEQLRNIIDTSLQGAGKSKLTNEVINSVGGFSSPNVRHLLNNLGAISNNYYEIGSHVGCSLISTVYGNNLESAIGCDNFSLFSSADHDSKKEFTTNCERWIKDRYTLLEKDCFLVTKEDLPNPIDLFFSDGSHDFDSQKNAIFYNARYLANECIVVIDDTDWEEPNGGTMKGFKQSGLNIEYIATFSSGIRSDCSERGFWNGIMIALVTK